MVLSEMSSLVSIFSVASFFNLVNLFIFNFSINLNLKHVTTNSFYNFSMLHFCFDPYRLTILWSFGDEVRNTNLFLWGFELTSNVCCLIKPVLVLLFLSMNISAGVRFVTLWYVDLLKIQSIFLLRFCYYNNSISSQFTLFEHIFLLDHLNFDDK